MQPEIFVIFVSDSRGRDLRTNPLPVSTLYQCEYIIKGGACIHNLQKDTLQLLSRYGRINPNALYIVKIAAGICDITKKVHHEGGVDIILRDRTYVLTKLLRFKEHILALGLKALVSFATIPPVSFKNAHSFNVSMGKNWSSIRSDEMRARDQLTLFEKLQHINNTLIQENSKPQQISNLGECRPSQLLWHQQVLREAKKKKTGKTVLRIPNTALVDGVHASPVVSKRWADTLLHSLSQDAHRLLSLRSPT
jgi:hypothetical protein